MAGKQLGKLRQWAGEVISLRDKTIVSDEFKELEYDIELRRQGLWKLHLASTSFQHRLSKKKACDAIEDSEKYLPIDALGVVMIQHGEEFGSDSAFGTSLVALGKAHSKVAILQESFALNISETYIASLQQAEDDIREFQVQRKKMDSRRLTLDSAITKVEKSRASKKDKEKKEAEDEYEVAKSRYEEITEDVRARMFAIQDNEIDQLRELTSFLDTEIQFVEQYLDVLKEAKSEWIDEPTLKQMERSRKARPPPPLPSRFGDESRFSSARSKGSISKARSTVSDESDTSGDDSDASAPRRKRTMSLKSAGSRPPSRPQSRTGRKRTESTASNMTEKVEKKDKDKERDKEREKEKAEKSKRMSIGGWASSIGKMTGRGKNKDRGKFDSLMADQDERGRYDESDGDVDRNEVDSMVTSPNLRSSSPTKSKNTAPTSSPQIPGRILRPPSQQDKKIAVALHDFAAASNDELSFKAGDQIIVLNEVIDGWWMGEHGGTGKTGLFPTTYTEVLNASTSSLGSKPPLPKRPSNNALSPSVVTSDVDHPFGDNHIAASRSPLYGGFDDESIKSDTGPDDDDDQTRLVPHSGDSDNGLHVYRAAPPPPPTRQLNIPSSKKAPPPPPPRRTTGIPQSQSAPAQPGISSSNSSTRTNSTNNSFVSVTNAQPDEEFTSSPFDNPKDGCGQFKQNPFKPKGFCNNCFHMH
ncbi:hypothetical protein BC835DRAFT_1466935 [Cytidiella melzeri]|nr:hypothetical protein BC835DRAFT_1466935 [Cytidiella melzeri]